MNRSVLSLLLPVFLVGVGPAALAQAGAESTPVTLNVSQVSVEAALKTLFAGAGSRNFVIDSDVPGAARVGTLSLSGVPFSVALRQVLGSISPPLVSELRDGVYHIQTGVRALPDLEARPRYSPPAQDARQNNFYKIRVKHYDAGMIADALTRPGGIIVLPPNFVIPSSFAASGAPGSPTMMTLGAARGLGPNAPNGGVPNGGVPPPGAQGTGNILPPGVKRIFILESDNSLVVEATSQGYDNLTGERLLSGGYTQVY